MNVSGKRSAISYQPSVRATVNLYIASAGTQLRQFVALKRQEADS
jgi:hypothetical protein